MLRKLRPRSVYDVLAAIAFFVAVAGGSAYAAATIGSSDVKKNAILSRHIKNGEVKNRDLGPNSVGTGKVIDGSLLKRDFRAGQLPDPGPRAISIPITHQKASSTRTIDGVRITFSCTPEPAVVLEVSPADAGRTVYVSGEKAEDGALSALNTSSTGFISAIAGATANLDVIATVNGTWNRIDVGGYNGGGTSGCNFWGLLIPGK